MKQVHRRLGILRNHIFGGYKVVDLLNTVHYSLPIASNVLAANSIEQPRSFHSSIPIENSKTSTTPTSNSFRQYWQSIFNYIQSGKGSLDESFSGINLSNINKVEVPEDVSHQLAMVYMKKLDREGKIRFFEVMIMHFGGIPIAPLLQMMKTSQQPSPDTNTDVLHQSIDKVKKSLLNIINQDEHVERNILNYLNSIQQLRNTLEPYYERFLEQFILTLMKKEISSMENDVPTSINGLEFIMQMRKDLLGIISTLQKNVDTEKPTTDYKKFILPILLNDLNQNLVRLLSSWFSPPFLQCKELDWRQTNAQLLENIIQYERVHPISDMESLKKRVSPTPNRKMYGLFHTAMPRVPLVVLQVALTDHIAENMREVHTISPAKPNVNTAIFYSISSTQGGLQGIELGNYLIKKVVGILQKKELVNDNYSGDISQFSTLSPIPGFMKWLSQKLRIECSEDESLRNKFHDEKLLSQEDLTLIKKLALEEPRLFGLTDKPSLNMTGYQLLFSLVNHINTSLDQTLHPSEALKPIMLKLCARYLINEKHKGKALDPVANFHLRNGACCERINWKGDLTPRRLKESYGLMVNYKYVLELIDENHHDYVISGATSIRLGELFDRRML